MSPRRCVAVHPESVGCALPDDVDWADLSQDQRWHYRNVAHNTQRTLDRRARLRAAVYEYKRDHCSCQRCGEDAPACLVFHHRNPDEKEGTVSKLISNGRSLEVIRAEIEKCDVLCANCHQQEHYEVPDPVTPPGEPSAASIDPD